MKTENSIPKDDKRADRCEDCEGFGIIFCNSCPIGVEKDKKAKHEQILEGQSYQVPILRG